MTRAQVIAAIAAQITAATAEGAITPAILGNIMNEAAELLNDVIPNTEIAVGTGTGIGSSAHFIFNEGAGLFVVGFGNEQFLKLNLAAEVYEFGRLNGTGSGDHFVVNCDIAAAYYDNVPHSGMFGINTSAPSAALHVLGTLKFVTTNQGANKVLTSDADGNADWVVQPLRYVALLNQTATDAPVPTELENSTGATFAWSYSSPGTYVISSNAGTPFTLNKTIVILSSGVSSEDAFINYSILSDSQIRVRSILAGTGPQDALMENTSIKIEIYP